MADTHLDKIVIGGRAISVGDVRAADFADIAEPKASVISLQETLSAILHALQGGVSKTT